MAKKTSAGVLLYRDSKGILEVFVVHPGGPYWAKKDAGAWSIPKGEFELGEDPFDAAKREFFEEIGTRVDGEFIQLSPLKQPSGKVIYAWAVKGNIDADLLKSNTFSIEWPPKSGVQREFPEVDRAAWYTLAEASEKLALGQRGFLDELKAKLDIGAGGLLI